MDQESNRVSPVDLADIRELFRSGAAEAIRHSRRLSLMEAARPAELSPSTVYRWEKGQRTPHGPPAVRYLKILRSLM